MNELQTRTFVDTALGFWRAWRSVETHPLTLLAIRVGGSQQRQILHLDAAPDSHQLAFTWFTGDDALRDAYLHFLSLGTVDAANEAIVPFVMLDFPRIASIKEKYLEIFREARMAHPAEGIVPVLEGRTSGGNLRKANAAEHRSMLQILLALKATGAARDDLFRVADGKTPLVELTVSGSPLRPQVERAEVSLPPPWELLDVRSLCGEVAEIPERKIGDATWRVDSLVRARGGHVHHAGCSHDHHEEVERCLTVTEPATGRVLWTGKLNDTSSSGLIASFHAALAAIASKDPDRAFPKRLESGIGLLIGFARRPLEARGIECVEVMPPAGYSDSITNSLAHDVLQHERETRRRALIEAFTDEQWLDCSRALVEVVTSPRSDASPGLPDLVLARYYANSLVDEYRDDLLSDDVARAARWGIATGNVDLANYFDGGVVPPAATAFAGALRSAKTSLYRVSDLATDDLDKIELVELLTGKRIDVTWERDRSNLSVNSMLIGRIVAIRGVKLFAELLPAMDPAEAFSFVRDLDTIGITLHDDGLDDFALGRVANWLYGLVDEVVEPIEPNINNEGGDEWPVIAAQETEAMLAALSKRQNFLGDRTLAEAARDPRLAPRARVAIHLWPAFGTVDHRSIEPDRERVARELGVPSVRIIARADS